MKYTRRDTWYTIAREVRIGRVFGYVQSATIMPQRRATPYFTLQFRVGRHTFVLTTVRGWGES